MNNYDYYEEVYPETISYDIYEAELDEKDREIDELENENYRLESHIEELEQKLEELNNAKKITYHNQNKINQKIITRRNFTEI